MTGSRVAVDGWQPIVGTVREVAARVRAARATGRCDAMTHPELVAGGRVRVYVRMRQPEQPDRRRRWPLIAAIATVSTAVSVTVAVLAVGWAFAHWQQLLGAGITAAALMAAIAHARRR